MSASRAAFRLPRKGRFLTSALALVLAACLPPDGGGPATPPATVDTPTTVGSPPDTRPPDRGDAMAPPPSWTEIDRWTAEQKLQLALDGVLARLAQARGGGDEEHTRALVTAVQLRTALHGYETAVRFLRDEPWPEAPLSRAVVQLFYAHSLTHYLGAYRWQIDQREQVVADTEVDLAKWTRAQLVAEARRAFLELWHERDRWGDASLGALGAYIEQNDYPARVRGTLRDTITYLWTAFLADSSLWSPRQSNEVYRLDLASLLASRGLETTDGADTDAHPLVLLSAGLGDLARWHDRDNRPEAALEARRTRGERLFVHFDRDEDKTAIEDDLARRLEALGNRYPWWSMGMATLAEWQRQREGGDSLIRARATARLGADRHPGTPGGERCAHLVATLDAPAYQLTAMAVDGPGKRSIEVGHKNVGRLHFRAYAIDLEAQLARKGSRNALPDHRQVQQMVNGGTPAASWTIDLPPTTDLRQHRTYVTPPLDQPGMYVVVASPRADFGERGNLMQAVSMQISDLVLLSRSQGPRHTVTLRSGSSGTPIAGGELTLYRIDMRQGGFQAIERARTDERGETLFTIAARSGQHLVVARHDGRTAIDPNTLTTYQQAVDRGNDAVLLYTDRSVYRPGQEVLWKVVAYHRGGTSETNNADGSAPPASRYRVRPDAQLRVQLFDANGQEVVNETVVTNAFGSASGRFTVPEDRVLGAWQLRTDQGGATQVRIEAYKRPTFEVAIDAPDTALRLNRQATLEGEARYYFGLPVTTGTVRWNVTREPVRPPWPFWDSFAYGGWGRMVLPRFDGPPQVVATGDAILDGDGRFTLAFTPEADERLASTGISYRYRLRAEVTDEGGETRNAQRAFRLGFVAVEASLDDPRGFHDAEAPIELSARRRDLDGAPRAGSGRWQLVRLAQPARTLLPAEQPMPRPPGRGPADDADPYATDGDRQRARWAPGYDPAQVLASWDDAEVLREGTLEHGEDGLANLDLGTLPGGAYRVRYQTDDPFGATFDTQHELVVVANEGTRLALPAMLRTARSQVAVGAQLELLAGSGVDGMPLLVEVLRGDRVVLRRTLDGGTLSRITLPVGEADRGGLGVRLTAVRDHQLMALRSNVFVPWDDRRLALSFGSFRDRLRPGTEETWTIVVEGPDGDAVDRGTVELLTYMHDKSLELFAPHTPPALLDVYPRRAGGAGVRTSLGTARRVWQGGRDFFSLPTYRSFRDDRLTFLDSYGIGGPGRSGGRFQTMAQAMPGQVAMKTRAMPSPPMAMEVDNAAPVAYAEGAAAADGGEESDASPPPADTAEAGLRSDFAETAFWFPHLVTEDQGSVHVTFTVPDAVTEWNVFVHALTSDLRGGSLQQQTRTAKDLLVRPYVPRFLRAGDTAELAIVIDNAGDVALDGHLDIDLYDPDLGEADEDRADLLDAFGLTKAQVERVPFRVEAGRSTRVRLPLSAPARPGAAALRVTAEAGNLRDGELRPLPVLPSRVHLVQSRFAALHDASTKALVFDELAQDEDPTRISEQLVVTLDAQLHLSVLSALPYLVTYPYETTDTLAHRFLAAGIVSALYDRYPAIARLGETLGERETPLEPWTENDVNRTLALEETPWLVAARGGEQAPDTELLRVLDPEVAQTTRDAALAGLTASQTADGGWPWRAGGAPSPYITLYTLATLSKALELGAPVPRELVAAGWRFLKTHYDRHWHPILERDGRCPEAVTMLNFLLSAYPDTSWTGGVFTNDDRRTMLDASFAAWRKHAPLLKGYLALTLHRADRGDDARLVWDSVMDASTTTEQSGTFWQPEAGAWLWYNDTVDGHAFALRTLLELAPEDERRHGLVQWLLLDKKLSHWRSTRSTAEALSALLAYLEREGTLGSEESATITVADTRHAFTFAPDRNTGRNQQVVVAGEDVGTDTARIEVTKTSPGLMFASATWHFSTEALPDASAGDLFAVDRRYFVRRMEGGHFTLRPLEDGARLQPGDQLEVEIEIEARHAAEYVLLRDPRPAGFEPEQTSSGYRFDLGIGWYEEIRDSGTNFFFEWLPAGTYTLRHRLRANLAGTFRSAPAQLQSVYAPAFAAYSAGRRIEIVPAEP